MDPESRAEPEPRLAGSIVADLIQDMNAAQQPAGAAKAVEEKPSAEESSTEEISTEESARAEFSTEESARAEFSTEEFSGAEFSTEESAEEATAEEATAEEATAEEATAELGEEPDVLIELDVDPGAIEAILLVVDEPLTAITLATVLDRPEPAVAEALRGLAMAYDAEQRGFDLREVAGGWRLYTREEYAEIVEKFVLDGQQAKLTQASLETLAVVAYRQPVSRSRVSAIRGVNCDGVMRTLISRGLIQEAGVEGESGATLYQTSSYFLERLGLNSLDELPDLAPYLPEMDEIEDAIHGESALSSSAGVSTDDEDEDDEDDDAQEAGQLPLGTDPSEPAEPSHQEPEDQ